MADDTRRADLKVKVALAKTKDCWPANAAGGRPTTDPLSENWEQIREALIAGPKPESER